MTHIPSPLQPINLIELPQPPGPLRIDRINKLLTLDEPQIALLTIPAIDLLKQEIEEYNDASLEQLTRKLKRQKKVKEIIVLRFQEMEAFNLREIEQTLAIIRWLDDQRLARHKSILEFQSYAERRKMREPPKTFVQSFKDAFSFSFLYSKEQPKKEEEQQSLTLRSQRQVGVNQFNFKYD